MVINMVSNLSKGSKSIASNLRQSMGSNPAMWREEERVSQKKDSMEVDQQEHKQPLTVWINPTISMHFFQVCFLFCAKQEGEERALEIYS